MTPEEVEETAENKEETALVNAGQEGTPGLLVDEGLVEPEIVVEEAAAEEEEETGAGTEGEEEEVGEEAEEGSA